LLFFNLQYFNVFFGLLLFHLFCKKNQIIKKHIIKFKNSCF
jgi:hypothetical protein